MRGLVVYTTLYSPLPVVQTDRNLILKKRRTYVTLFCPDAIDNRQNKKALQIADKIIKKQEDLYCAKVCRSFC